MLAPTQGDLLILYSLMDKLTAVNTERTWMLRIHYSRVINIQNSEIILAHNFGEKMSREIILSQ